MPLETGHSERQNSTVHETHIQDTLSVDLDSKGVVLFHACVPSTVSWHLRRSKEKEELMMVAQLQRCLLKL